MPFTYSAGDKIQDMKKDLVIVEWIDICQFDSGMANKDYEQARFFSFGLLWRKFKNKYGHKIVRIILRFDMERTSEYWEDDFIDIPESVILSIRKAKTVELK